MIGDHMTHTRIATAVIGATPIAILAAFGLLIPALAMLVVGAVIVAVSK